MQQFPIRPIERLRNRAAKIGDRFADHPAGWSVDRSAARDLLKLFSRLRPRDGWSLLTAAHTDGANGRGWTWAFPPGIAIATPELDDLEWEPRPPDGAAGHYMEAVTGDGSLRSFMQASIFSREVEELGALWHGIDWGTHVLIDSPLDDDRREEWTWERARPSDWHPTAAREGDDVLVRFYTRSDLGQARLVEHLDRYAASTLVATHSEMTLATGRGGYVF